eukprot:981516-Karenia_brevis.AAC.1
MVLSTPSWDECCTLTQIELNASMPCQSILHDQQSCIMLFRATYQEHIVNQAWHMHIHLLFRELPGRLLQRNSQASREG